MSQQKPETKIKMKDAKKYRAIYYWLQEFRENLVGERSPSEPWGNPELGYRDTSRFSHELPIGSRAKVEPGSGKLSGYTRTIRKPKL